MSNSAISDSPRTGIKWWLWLNLLSLDAPIVAILWQSALAHCYRVNLLPGAQITLFLAVWLIYMVDRVLDSYAPVSAERMSARHAFYRRNRKLFSMVAIPAASVLLALLSFLTIPAAVMVRGATLAFVVALYLLHFAARKHRTIYITGNIIICALGIAALWWLPLPPNFRLGVSSGLLGMFAVALTPRWHGIFQMVPKELICGYLFAMGCSLNVGFYSMDAYARPFSPEVLLMALLFTLNCVAIACYERQTDAATDPNSISQTWPGIVRMYPALLVTFGVFAAIIVPRAIHPEMISLTLAVTLSTLFLATLHVFARRFTPELSRVLVDVAVALPIVLLIARA
ncbi:MAG: hypothetical protein K8R87_10880 [Verrucomicrobia bacterium]|nr:hypothetical protein [Verrucomicrobiota bacterium]